MLRILSLLVCFLPFHLSSNLFTIRGGLVPQADKVGGEYYEKYELDYGTDDKRRFAGALRGFLDITKLQGLKEKDPFLKWWNKHLEEGPSEVTGRLKPIYAADFGSKADLKKGKNPKIVIVQRKLQAKSNGILSTPQDGSDLDVEVREIKNPFLRARCNFAVRYVVPNRVNIIRIMEANNRFKSEACVEDVVVNGKSNKMGTQLATTLTFRPTLFQRLFQGRRDIIVKRVLSNDLLYKPQQDVKTPFQSTQSSRPRVSKARQSSRGSSTKATKSTNDNVPKTTSKAETKTVPKATPKAVSNPKQTPKSASTTTAPPSSSKSIAATSKTTVPRRVTTTKATNTRRSVHGTKKSAANGAPKKG